MTGEALPIRDDEIRGLLAPLEPFGVLVLAVSGGADSTALMHLAARWRELGYGAQKWIVVATVDHGLRPESADEAKWVGEKARALGFAHETLTWTGPKPETALQETAREARYALLTALAGRIAASAPAAVVTAHHRDDQVETFLMRLARGSGLDGLSGIATSRPAGVCTLARPLLGVAKARLVATLQDVGATWIEDPSNARPEFERIRLRQAAGALEALGLEPGPIAESVRRLQDARASLDFATTGLARAAGLDLHGGVFAELRLETLAGAPGDLGVRLLARLLKAFGGQAEPPRLAKIEALRDRLQTDGWSGATLGGCTLTRCGERLRVYRETGRADLEEMRIEPGGEAMWDRRFLIGVAGGVSGPVLVRQLGKRGYAAIRGSLSERSLPPAVAAETLPAFWKGGTLVAVPPLCYAADCCEPDAFRAEFIGL